MISARTDVICQPEEIPEEHDGDVLVLGAVHGEPAHVDDLDQLQDLPVHVLVGTRPPLRRLGALLETKVV